MTKKTIIYAGIVAGVILALYFIWTFFVPKPAPPTTTTSTGQTGSLPQGTTTGATGGAAGATTTTGIGTSTLPIVMKISDHDVFKYWLDKNSGEVKYISNDGEVLVAGSGQNSTESNQTLSGLNTVEPSLDGSKVLVSFGGQSNPRWAVYNSGDGSWSSLPQTLINVVWGANTNQLIGVTTNAGSYALSYVDLSKNPPMVKVIVPNFYMSGANLAFHASTTLIVTEEPSASYAASVWEMNLKNLSLNEILSPQSGLYAIPTSNGSLIYENTGNGSITINTDTLASFKFPFPTLPDKCDSSATPSSSDLYCFSPTNITSNLVMPDDYLERAFYSVDVLYDYNPATGNTNSVLLSGAPNVPIMDAKDVTVWNGNLYFINRYDNSLYQVRLPS